MKKIGIITINDYSNYGNRLQNYATQLFLQKQGYFVCTIRNTVNSSSESKKSLSKKIRDIGLKNSILLIKNKIKNKKNEKLILEKIKKFKKFTKQYINETEYVISSDSIPVEINEEFNYFITGSDQVWNPHYRYGSPIDFLTFANPSKRITFSPSFGVSAIPIEYHENYARWLTEMKALSVREEAGVDIIKKLTGRDSEVLVDPTLLLSREEWLEISKPPFFKPNKRFILTYFLGDKGKKISKEVNKFAKQNKLLVINLLDIRDKEAFTADPAEFIDLINSASLVLTDSFHGTIFSIIMKKPFVVFDRIENNNIKMNSRIDTLLKKFNLENRYYKNLDLKKNLYTTQYDHVDKIIEYECKKTINYLNKAFNN